MKILLFARDLMVGGSQRQLALLAAGLARRGHAVSVAVLYAGGALEPMLADIGVRLFSTGKSGRWHLVAPLARLRQFFIAERPDVLYAFLPMQTTLAATMLPRRRRTKLVFGLRACGMQLDRYGALEGLTYRTEVALSRRADLLIANARSIRADAAARGIAAERIIIVPNGIDIETMRPDKAAGEAVRRVWNIAEDAFVIGCVARLDPMKDHSTFIAAAAQFARSNRDTFFVCVGDGPTSYRNELKAKARAYDLEGQIRWTGELADMRAAYSAFDIATLPSAFGEGFPNVIGEAMACGVPVVATDVGDSRLVVGDVGEIVPPSDPVRLRDGWTRLRQRLAREKDLPQAARAFIAANYTVDNMVSRTEKALLGLTTGGCSAGEIVPEFP